MAAKEAQARIKLNKLLEEAGWRFFDDGKGKANIVLEPKVKLTQAAVDALGENFEATSNGFIDFLLLDEAGFPLVVLEAKAKDKNPLIGKEQARKYAKSQNCRFVILSNGNLHYFWDLEQGNPHIITRFPTPESIKGYPRQSPALQGRPAYTRRHKAPRRQHPRLRYLAGHGAPVAGEPVSARLHRPAHRRIRHIDQRREVERNG